ncbi:MAG: NAD(P)/FAD-dependent oxidoreductase [Vicinamibacteria bacterium]|nr:NAD(P)/FAD-dependent oxidoreductase [Vicinamibacteria bacterium]
MGDSFDLIVLGGGAAGLFCAARAGRRGRRVVLLERNREVGRKILISGGGRCNFTNIHCRPEHFLSNNPHFARSALARYTPADFISLVERHGVAWHEKTLGQLFCDGSARQIVDLLLAECRDGGVRIEVDCDVTAPPPARPPFVVETSRGRFEALSLVVATGGLSIPKIGATDLGYRIAAQFGVPVVPPRPALVPLLFDEAGRRRWSELAGVAADCVASASGASFREQLLFTHRGLSGPAILQASSYWHDGGTVEIDLLPDVDILAELTSRRAAGETAAPKTIVARHLPNRLADRWFDDDVGGVLATTSNERLAAIADRLHRWSVVPSGTEGYTKAEVTAGGVDTRALSSRTMEAREVPGLYFIGEVVDVTGHLGGFNFQWAWASAAAAADAV